MKEKRVDELKKRTDDVLDMVHVKEAGEKADERKEEKQAEAAAKTVEEGTFYKP